MQACEPTSIGGPRRQHVVYHGGCENDLPSIFPHTSVVQARERKTERHPHGWPHPHASIARLLPFGLNHLLGNAPPRLALQTPSSLSAFKVRGFAIFLHVISHTFSTCLSLPPISAQISSRSIAIIGFLSSSSPHRCEVRGRTPQASDGAARFIISPMLST